MAGTIGISGFERIAQEYCDYLFDKTAQLRLYKDDYTPDLDCSSHAFTDATVLSPWFLANTNLYVTLDSGVGFELSGTNYTWTQSGSTGETVYGFYCIDSDGFKHFAWRFADGPYTSVYDGDRIVLDEFHLPFSVCS